MKVQYLVEKNSFLTCFFYIKNFVKSLLISYVSYVCRTLAKKETFQATPKAAVVDAPVANISNIKLSEPPSYKKGMYCIFYYIYIFFTISCRLFSISIGFTKKINVSILSIFEK